MATIRNHPGFGPSHLAGMVGLEPTNAGVKVPCLTTWLHPNVGKMKENMGLGSPPNPMFSMGWVMGLEPTTLGTTIRCSNQLSYTHHIVYPMENGTPEGTRTPGLLLRRQLLYPAELLAHMERVTRIELASPAWKAGALAIVLYPQVPSETNRQL